MLDQFACVIVQRANELERILEEAEAISKAAAERERAARELELQEKEARHRRIEQRKSEKAATKQPDDLDDILAAIEGATVSEKKIEVKKKKKK